DHRHHLPPPCMLHQALGALQAPRRDDERHHLDERRALECLGRVAHQRPAEHREEGLLHAAEAPPGSGPHDHCAGTARVCTLWLHALSTLYPSQAGNSMAFILARLRIPPWLWFSPVGPVSPATPTTQGACVARPCPVLPWPGGAGLTGCIAHHVQRGASRAPTAHGSGRGRSG